MSTRREFLAASAALAAAPLLTADEKPVPGKTKNTKFAVNVEMWFRKEVDFLKRLEATAALGFPAVEFWPWQGRNVGGIAETCERLKLEVAQFTAWGFKPGLNEVKNHNRFVEAIEEGCEAAKKLRCKMMTVVAGDDVAGLTQEQMHDNVIAGLKRAAPVAEKHGVTLILEPMNIKVDHKGHCLYGSAPAIKIVKAVGSKFVKINWDLYHMYITEGELIENLKKGFDADAIAYIQLADHPGRNEPGTGEIDYTPVLRALKKDFGYNGIVGLECRPRGTEMMAALAVNRADAW